MLPTLNLLLRHPFQSVLWTTHWCYSHLLMPLLLPLPQQLYYFYSKTCFCSVALLKIYSTDYADVWVDFFGPSHTDDGLNSVSTTALMGTKLEALLTSRLIY